MARRTHVFDPDLGIRMLPNVRARVRHESGGFLIAANSDGFRDKEFQVRRSPGKRRILLYGDSFTYGDGVARTDRFGDLLQAALPDVEIYNLGIVGSGTDQQFLAHRLVGARLEYDMVLIAPWVENIKRNVQHYRLWKETSPGYPDELELLWLAKPYFELDPSGRLSLHNQPVPPPTPYAGAHDFAADETGVGRLDGLRWRLCERHPRLKDLLQRVIRYQPAGPYQRPDDPAWLLMKAILTQWSDEVDTPVLICPIPMYQHIEGAASAKAVGERFAELHRPESGVHVFDALPAMAQGSRRERRSLRFATDIHFSPAGHRAFADAIVREVARVLDEAAVPHAGVK